MSCCFRAFPMPLFRLHFTYDKGWTQHVPKFCVSFLTLPSLFLLLLFPKWIGFVLGAILCVSMIKTCAPLNYSETLATVSSLSYWILHCSPLTMIGWPPVFWGILLILGGTSFLLGVPSFYLRKESCESLHRQCMWSMLCCYENKHQNMYVMIFYYVFAFGIEFSNFHQNLSEPFTAMIIGASPVCLLWWFIDFWLYFYIYF